MQDQTEQQPTTNGALEGVASTPQADYPRRVEALRNDLREQQLEISDAVPREAQRDPESYERSVHARVDVGLARMLSLALSAAGRNLHAALSEAAALELLHSAKVRYNESLDKHIERWALRELERRRDEVAPRISANA